MTGNAKQKRRPPSAIRLLVIVSFLFASCATISPDERRFNADELAYKSGLMKELVRADPFVLTAYFRIPQPGAPLNIYIEGDGYAFVTPTRVSGDPTPRDPVALKLAAKDSSANVVYLARPCQFTPENKNPACEVFYWTNGRFSEEVVVSTDRAVSEFVERAKTKQVNLVGYSGGAAVAVLVAARRQDVSSIRTVGGNLAPEIVNEAHGVSPLDGSLDPLEAAPKIASIPQLHFVGGDDDVVPFAAAEAFAKTQNSPCFHFKTLPNASHSTGWEKEWPQLLRIPVSCAE